MKSVFISSVKENSSPVQALAHALKKHAIQVWLDQAYTASGNQWEKTIQPKIARSEFFVACFSTEYYDNSNSWMNTEILEAIRQLRQ